MILFNFPAISGGGGWVSGSIASLAASTPVTIVHDLSAASDATGGFDWHRINSVVVAIANGTTSAGGTVKAYWSDDGTTTNQVPAVAIYNPAGGQSVYSGDLSIYAEQYAVQKRFLLVVFTNGATPQNASALLSITGLDQ